MSKFTLACLLHVKRSISAAGYGSRPDAPPPYGDVVMVLDRSGSMAGMIAGSQAGVRHFMTAQKDAKRTNTWIEVTTFDTLAEIAYEGWTSLMMPGDIEKTVLALQPRDLTRLYDTAVEALNRQDRRLTKWWNGLSRKAKLLKPKPVVVVFVLTDGMDNQSRLANAAALKRALAKCKKKWNATDIFAAANQDAFVAGELYGFSQAQTMQMDANPVRCQAAFKCASASAARAQSGLAPALTKRERQTTTQGAWRPPLGRAARAANVTAPAGYGGYGSDSDDDDSDCDSNMACMGGGGGGPLNIPPGGAALLARAHNHGPRAAAGINTFWGQAAQNMAYPGGFAPPPRRPRRGRQLTAAARAPSVPAVLPMPSLAKTKTDH